MTIRLMAFIGLTAAPAAGGSGQTIQAAQMSDIAGSVSFAVEIGGDALQLPANAVGICFYDDEGTSFTYALGEDDQVEIPTTEAPETPHRWTTYCGRDVVGVRGGQWFKTGAV